MLRVHHLRVGRPLFTLWLIEELGLDYELVTYDRDPKTFRAPPALRDVHPLGKSPVIEDEGGVIAESGAIAQHLCETRDPEGRLGPIEGERTRWLEWLHYAEGSGALPLMLTMLAGRERAETKLLDGFARAEVALHLDYLEAALKGRDWLIGERLTAPDCGVAWLVSTAKTLGVLGDRPALAAYLKRCVARPAFQRAKARAGA